MLDTPKMDYIGSNYAKKSNYSDVLAKELVCNHFITT